MPHGSCTSPSEQLKEIRNRLGITTRDVAEFSHRIAQAEDNTEFHISNAWLTQIENSDSVPSIFKLYSLSSIYRIKFSDILLLYGVDLQHLTKHQMSAPLPKTHLTTLEVYDTDKTVSFPVRFDRSFDVDNTNLLSRMVEVWGEVPIALIQHLDLRHSFTDISAARQHAFAVVAARVVCANRSARAQDPAVPLAHRI